MADVLTSITDLALVLFREKARGDHKPPFWLTSGLLREPTIQGAERAAWLDLQKRPDVQKVVELALQVPELAQLGPNADALDPMVLHPGGGVRMSGEMLVGGIFVAAFAQIHILRLPADEGTYVRTVLENFDELRRAARGERVRANALTGFARISIPEGRQIITPWGVLRPAPPIDPQFQIIEFGRTRTTCTLTESRLVPVRFDRAADASPKFDPADIAANAADLLLPLSCALASPRTAEPVLPLHTFSTTMLPFLGTGFSYSFPMRGPTFGPDSNLEDAITDVEEWARIVQRAHVPSVDVAARRLASAIGHRLDRADALIDAVMVWENLVGTSAEVSFRVTAALAKVIEKNPRERVAVRKSLSKIYSLRSGVVHGSSVDSAAVHKACGEAIDVAIRALRDSYKRGKEWLELGSTQRADAILLEWE